MTETENLISNEMYEDKPFNKRNQLTVFLDYISHEHALFSLGEFFSQYYPVTQCFLLIRTEKLPQDIDDIQILFPYIKIYHRPQANFVSAVIELSKILDTQFVAAFSNCKLNGNKWLFSEAIGKIHNRESWNIIFDKSTVSFLALRMALEKASIESIKELSGS